MPITGFHAAGFYNPVTNSLEVDPVDLITGVNLVHEASNGVQFNDHEIKSVLRYLGDCASVLENAKSLTMHDLCKQYFKLYQTPGSIEYEAHHVIDNKLKKKYPILKKLGTEKEDLLADL